MTGTPYVCGLAFPVLVGICTVYAKCDLPKGHETPCAGRVSALDVPSIRIDLRPTSNQTPPLVAG